MDCSPNWSSAAPEVAQKPKKLKATFIVALVALLSLQFFATAAFAKPVVLNRLVSTKTAVERNCLIDGGTMTTEPSGHYSCLNTSTGIATNCSSFGACEVLCTGKGCGGDVRKSGAAAGNNKGGAAAKPTAGGSASAPAPVRRSPVDGTATVRDHRSPVVVAAPSKGPPPAAAPGTASGDATHASTPGPAVRDHRRGGNSERK